MSKWFIVGHSGFGDSLHQRAAVRKILDRGDELWLSTATPCVYHDFPRDRLHFVNNYTGLRTQAKNREREIDRFGTQPPAEALCLRASYDGARVKAQGSVVAAMCMAFGVSAADADFRMPVPQTWINKTPIPSRPFILYRPPVARTEWAGAEPRNPLPEQYAEVFAAVRAGYQVVSVADLEPGREWIVGEEVAADLTYHAGEMDFEQLAVLAKHAAFVFTTAGMMTVLAQAVEAPCITVFGGYEDAQSFSAGGRWAPWLPIEPINPCACWSHTHACDKRIDVPQALADVRTFVEDLNARRQAA